MLGAGYAVAFMAFGTLHIAANITQSTEAVFVMTNDAQDNEVIS